MIHELKTWPIPFRAVVRGEKTFEVRKNDRHFLAGHELLLREFTPADYWEDGKPESYSGAICHRRITYILKGGQFGIEEGYVVLALEKI